MFLSSDSERELKKIDKTVVESRCKTKVTRIRGLFKKVPK